MNETYTAWIRGRLPKYERPQVEYMDNLNPSVVIDIGPDGGTSGGEVVFTGTPQEMIEHADTITAKYLRK